MWKSVILNVFEMCHFFLFFKLCSCCF